MLISGGLGTTNKRIREVKQEGGGEEKKRMMEKRRREAGGSHNKV
jgi:hypothetical protein